MGGTLPPSGGDVSSVAPVSTSARAEMAHAVGRSARGGVCIRGEVDVILADMRDISSPVLDPADAGRGLLHALQALILGLFLLLVL